MALKDLIQTGSDNPVPKILLYGLPGVGKSSFGKELPKPVFIQAEDGIRGSNFDGVARLPAVQSYEDLIKQLNMLLLDEHDFKSVVVDTIDWCQRFIFDDIAHTAGKEDVSDIGYFQGYRKAEKKLYTILNLLDEIHAKKILICLLGHAQIERENMPDVESFDTYSLAMHKYLAPKVMDWCDIVLFVNFKTFVKPSGESFGKTTYKAVNGSLPRTMYTEKRAAFKAKNRYSLPTEMNFIEGSTWKELSGFLFKKGEK